MKIVLKVYTKYNGKPVLAGMLGEDMVFRKAVKQRHAKCQDCGDMGFFLDADNDPWPCVEGCPPKVYEFARYAQETYGVTVDIELLNRWAEEIKNERTDQFGNLRSDEPGKSNT